MKNSIFSDKLQGKALRIAKADHKRAMRDTLREYAPALYGALKRLMQSADKRSRDVANAANGKYSALAAEEITRLVSEGVLDKHSARTYVAVYIVSECYPWLECKAGRLMCKRKEEREDGTEVRVWRERKQTKAAADGIMLKALSNFVDGCGNPVQEYHADGEIVGE